VPDSIAAPAQLLAQDAGSSAGSASCAEQAQPPAQQARAQCAVMLQALGSGVTGTPVIDVSIESMLA
jgi:hypothetical protein